jgi:Rps23 Pro-64 3,4-dihydroxylase Tpa1-like proline 4-hydroxylase
MANTLVTTPIFNTGALDALSARAADFLTGAPFPHIVVDGLFNPEFLLEVERAYYPHGDKRWYRFADQSREVKLSLNEEDHMPLAVQQILRELNSAPFLKRLSALTGVEALIPDPYYYGGGMHQIERGGKLAIHADYDKHPLLKLDRRLNLLVYLNEDWEDEYGGHFELWDKSMQQCVKRVAPLFNRMVIFLTDDFSYHGHPDPLKCPAGRARKSLALYYYTCGRPDSELSAQAGHSTLFKERPDERFKEPRFQGLKQSLERLNYVLRRRAPRPLVRLWKRLRKRKE